MKGAIFIALNEMIESQYDINTWEDILERVQPESKGIYTSTCEYADAEMLRFIDVIASLLKIDDIQFKRQFGRFLFSQLNDKYPIFTQIKPDLFGFIASVEEVIHKEVKKFYENPRLPSLRCEVVNNHEMIIRYYSDRKLCYLAEGLVLGAADHYGKHVRISQSQCLHLGDKCCDIRVMLDD